MNNQTLQIDLNSDMGEGFGAWRMGDDEAILDIVSSANVACGFHAGDPEIMAHTFAQAKARGVAVGAHPGYPDLWGFGRRIIPFSAAEIERLVAYQVGAALALSRYAGHPITYVKAHGALGNLTQTDASVATAIARAVKAVDPELICVTFAGGLLIPIANDLGLRTRAEVFADRAYTEEGHLVHRKEPGAVLHDAQFAARRMLRMVQAGGIETVSGRMLPVHIDTICVHSDTPGAISMAAQVRATLEQAGVAIKPFC
ncbi:LamB/YcsF family protein [Pseudomonas tolaasii]|uniref:5-oxoprolinase subunit A n=2 Tax=Pseudomonas tolaasii TaxID=29442 RepID=A0A7Y8AUR2_PSETO|nr:5-oxoprolinase subunit PxpA [Pseudomonas tolaasii]ARB27393.1 LamB/YcsF family protein [Pseudomonas tolaasii]KAB0467500.1 LamB/YcsF family protein [Pseudomonas tolaasii]MBY8943289.1 LamB/YcsF family protein [Pseudomonas tolaasii]NVZ48448.1 LamB/YcsF family protein [Pseudomonas tolaasii]NWA48105.1 LamB/YcsF family protein [Pseudomonas tolaasii]